MTIETSKTKSKEIKRLEEKNQNRISTNCGTTKHMCNGNIRKRRKKQAIFKATMTENFPRLMCDIKAHIQKAPRTPSRINSRKTIPNHVIFKVQKIKNKEKHPERTQRRGKIPKSYI